MNKWWRIRNSGSTTWGPGYALAFVGGDQMGAPSPVPVPSTAPGSTADISVTFTAPASPGTYRSEWCMRDPQGVYFGDRVWLQLGDPQGSQDLTGPSGTPVYPQLALRPYLRLHYMDGLQGSQGLPWR